VRSGLRGGYVLDQDETSSDVYGMNKVAYREGNVDRQFALSEFYARIGRLTSRPLDLRLLGAQGSASENPAEILNPEP
jgi:hypothetical protein